MQVFHQARILFDLPIREILRCDLSKRHHGCQRDLDPSRLSHNLLRIVSSRQKPIIGRGIPQRGKVSDMIGDARFMSLPSSYPRLSEKTQGERYERKDVCKAQRAAASLM